MEDESFVGVFSHGCNRGDFEVFDISSGLTYCPTIFNVAYILRYFLVPTLPLFSDKSEDLLGDKTSTHRTSVP